jgi:transcriptional regulator with XRE-family HTH domain
MEKSISSQHLRALLDTLRQTREGASLRQLDVAERLGVPQSFISKYESGERRLDLLELEQVCEACGTSLFDFLTRYQQNKKAAE